MALGRWAKAILLRRHLLPSFHIVMRNEKLLKNLCALWNIAEAAVLILGCVQSTAAQSGTDAKQNPERNNTYIERRRDAGGFVAVSVLTGYPQPLPQATRAFPLVVSLSRGVFEPGEPISISITTTNAFSKTLIAYSFTPENDFNYEIIRLNKAGVEVPVAWTAYGNDIFKPKLFYDRAVYRFDDYAGWMSVGETHTAGPVLISRLFDMSQSGIYVIQVLQLDRLEGKNITLSAMPVTITVN